MSGAAKKKPAEKKPSELLGPPERGTVSSSSPDEFLDRHRRARFVMDFFDSKHYAARNVFLDMKHRVLEAAKLMCWANFCDFVADKKGRPAGVTEIAWLIGAPTQRVSEACETLHEECLLRVVGRIIFVIDDPELERQFRKRRTKGKSFPGRVGKSFALLSPTEKKAVLSLWAKHSPNRFQHYQKVDVEFQQKADERRVLQDEALGFYEAFTKEEPPQDAPAEEKASEPISRPVRENRHSRPVRETVPDPSGKGDGASLFGFKASFKELASYEQKIRDAVANSGFTHLTGNLAKAIRRAAEKLANEDPPLNAPQLEAVVAHYTSDLQQAARRRNNRPTSWGFVVSAMQDAIAAVGQQPQETPRSEPVTDSEPSLEEQIRTLEKEITTLEAELPNQISLPGMRIRLAELRSQQETKGPQSESHTAAKAKRAGQA